MLIFVLRVLALPIRSQTIGFANRFAITRRFEQGTYANVSHAAADGVRYGRHLSRRLSAIGKLAQARANYQAKDNLRRGYEQATAVIG
jgi:hypothetical protein